MRDMREGKGSSPSVIAAYRKRQERAMRLLVISWIGVMIFIIGIGYVIYRFLIPGNSQQVQEYTETPTALASPAPGTPSLSPTIETAAEILDQTEPPPPTPTPSGPRIVTYTVKEGDTLFSIATQFGIGLADLTALNPLVTPEFLSVGDQLSVPSQGDVLPSVTPETASELDYLDYNVSSGDTLAAIAARFGSSIDSIVRENNLESPDQIYIGQALRIPVEAGAAATPTPASEDPEPGATATPTQGS